MSKTYLGIDIGSTKICAVIGQLLDSGEVKVLGFGTCKSSGIQKGKITSIEPVAKSIQKAVNDTKHMAGVPYDKVLVCVSGAYTKGIEAEAYINVNGGEEGASEISIKDIKRVMQTADHYANIHPDFDKLHVIPYMFKVDDQENIENPLGMIANKLAVKAHIITIQKSFLSNIRKAVKLANINIDNFVLAGYASAIAVLNEDEKELGACVIDMGGDTCDMVICTNNAVRYNDFLQVGSSNITLDMADYTKIPIAVAEEIKHTRNILDKQPNQTIELPVLGEEEKTHQVALEAIGNVAFARMQETFMLLATMLERSNFSKQIGAGVVLTGGFTKLAGTKDFASVLFDNIPVRIAKPRALGGLFGELDDQMYSTAIGLVLYGAGAYTPYEIDSNKKMRHKDEEDSQTSENFNTSLEEETLENIKLDSKKELKKSPKEDLADLTLETNNKNSIFTRFWNWLTQLF